jgi:cobalt-precorrin 5A hydrolase
MGTAKAEADSKAPIAIIAITRHGVGLALQLWARLPGSVCFVPSRYEFAIAVGAQGFESFKALLPTVWGRHHAIVCIMATGIVVRQIAPLLKSKTVDPAVVVLDEKGRFVISLLSGHLGGANRLAEKVAELVGGHAVITTASDVQEKPAVDLIAREAGLEIENMELTALLTRCLLDDEPVRIFDPEHRLVSYFAQQPNVVWLPDSPPHGEANGGDEDREGSSHDDSESRVSQNEAPGIWVSEREPADQSKWLLLRPKNLVVGLGCNRGTSSAELTLLVRRTFAAERLSTLAIRNFASIDLKADEPAIIATAKLFDRPVVFFSREQLRAISVPNPSNLVKMHVGVPSVCEAAALLSAQATRLIIPKQKTANATLAVARVGSPL